MQIPGIINMAGRKNGVQSRSEANIATLLINIWLINDQRSNLEECIDKGFCLAVHISFWSGSLQFVN